MRTHRRTRLYRLSLGALGLVVVLTVLANIGLGYWDSDNQDAAHLVSMPSRSGLTDGSSTDAPSETPGDAPTSETPQPVQPRNEPPPQAPVAPAPGWQGPPATTPAEAVSHALSAVGNRASRAAVAVYDRRSGTLYSAGNVDAPFASASVVKVFIATRLIVDGQADEPGVRDQMWRMIVASDDDAASALYVKVGYEDLIPWIANRYGVAGLAPASIHNYWGLTQITARSMTLFYAKIANDTKVGPWLLDAMANAQSTGSDGFPQYFGLPSAAQRWRVKQGWMCCLENVTRMHSTGLVDGDRYTVALLTEGPRSMYGNYGALTLTVMAQALMPDGVIPQSGPEPPPTTDPPPPPTPNPTPTTTPTPTATPTLTATATRTRRLVDF